MKKIKEFLPIIVIVLGTASMIFGASLFGIGIRRERIKKDKIERMQFVKDSLQIELLKQNLIKNGNNLR